MSLFRKISFAMATTLAVGPTLIVAPPATAQQRPSAASPAATVRNCAWIAQHVEAKFDSMPPGWVVEQNVMDAIWTPLRVRGVNFFAYGGAVAPRTFAARSDPDSPLYQAWFGVYVVPDSLAPRPEMPMRLAALDQRSWLAAMGDPHPAFKLLRTRKHETIVIAGALRPLYTFDATTHSDLGPGATPLAQHLGMPPVASWSHALAPFHELTLHGYYTYWYDTARGLTMIVYACAAEFDRSGFRRDNFPALETTLLRMVRNVHLQERASSADTA